MHCTRSSTGCRTDGFVERLWWIGWRLCQHGRLGRGLRIWIDVDDYRLDGLDELQRYGHWQY
jgi:hypothetical protein